MTHGAPGRGDILLAAQTLCGYQPQMTEECRYEVGNRLFEWLDYTHKREMEDEMALSAGRSNTVTKTKANGEKVAITLTRTQQLLVGVGCLAWCAVFAAIPFAILVAILT